MRDMTANLLYAKLVISAFLLFGASAAIAFDDPFPTKSIGESPQQESFNHLVPANLADYSAIFSAFYAGGHKNGASGRAPLFFPDEFNAAADIKITAFDVIAPKSGTRHAVWRVRCDPRIQSTSQRLKDGTFGVSLSLLMVCRNVDSGIVDTYTFEQAVRPSTSSFSTGVSVDTVPGTYAVTAVIALVQPDSAPRLLAVRSTNVTVPPVYTIEELRQELRRLRSDPTNADFISDHEDYVVAATEFGSTFVKVLKELGGFQKLDLRQRPITDSDLKELTAIESLKALSLRKTLIEGSALDQLLRIPGLQSLDLSDCPIAPGSIAKLHGLASLRTIKLSGLSLSVDDWNVLAAFKELRDLDLSRTNLSDANCASLSSLLRPETLNISQTRVTTKGLALLSAFSRLTTLDIAGTRLTDDAWPIIKSFKNLERLDVAGSLITSPKINEFVPTTRLRNVYVDQRQNEGVKHSIANIAILPVGR